jgi:hypothetical protein
MMLRRLASLVTVCVMFVPALLVAGCGSGAASVAGVYELDKEAVKTSIQAEMKKAEESGDAEMGAQFGGAMILGMIDSLTMTVTLNADGTASMVADIMGDQNTATGTWKLDGEAITITAVSPGEEPETITGTVAGSKMTLKSPDGDEMPFDMVFKKKAT